LRLLSNENPQAEACANETNRVLFGTSGINMLVTSRALESQDSLFSE
jgi:hypothetical protein